MCHSQLDWVNILKEKVQLKCRKTLNGLLTECSYQAQEVRRAEGLGYFTLK